MPDLNVGVEAPLARKHQRTVVAVTIAADTNTNLIQAEGDGAVDSVVYIPAAAITGANTDYRSVVLVNKGAAGSGTTVMATLAFTSGVNASAAVAKTIVLSAVAGALTVATGDVLQWQSTHTGSTGMVDPGGLVVITVGRT